MLLNEMKTLQETPLIESAEYQDQNQDSNALTKQEMHDEFAEIENLIEKMKRTKGRAAKRRLLAIYN